MEAAVGSVGTRLHSALMDPMVESSRRCWLMSAMPRLGWFSTTGQLAGAARVAEVRLLNMRKPVVLLTVGLAESSARVARKRSQPLAGGAASQDRPEVSRCWPVGDPAGGGGG